MCDKYTTGSIANDSAGAIDVLYHVIDPAAAVGPATVGTQRRVIKYATGYIGDHGQIFLRSSIYDIVLSYATTAVPRATVLTIYSA